MCLVRTLDTTSFAYSIWLGIFFSINAAVIKYKIHRNHILWCSHFWKKKLGFRSKMHLMNSANMTCAKWFCRICLLNIFFFFCEKKKTVFNLLESLAVDRNQSIYQREIIWKNWKTRTPSAKTSQGRKRMDESPLKTSKSNYSIFEKYQRLLISKLLSFLFTLWCSFLPFHPLVLEPWHASSFRMNIFFRLSLGIMLFLPNKKKKKKT